MFGHNLMDVRINDQVVPIIGYKLNHKHILIDGNLAKVRNDFSQYFCWISEVISKKVGLIYSIPGQCSEFLTVVESSDTEVRVVGNLVFDDLSGFDTAEDAEVSWKLQNSDLYRITQWSTSRKTGTTILKFSLDGNNYKPINFSKAERNLDPDGKFIFPPPNF